MLTNDPNCVLPDSNDILVYWKVTGLFNPRVDGVQKAAKLQSCKADQRQLRMKLKGQKANSVKDRLPDRSQPKLHGDVFVFEKFHVLVFGLVL